MDYSLSVVIPNYNNEKYIEKCLLSVINQTYAGLRNIIVVDDASTDGSRDIITKVSKLDKRIKLIFLETNRKVSTARNTGLASVTTEYVTFLDGDDYYFNVDKLKNEMNTIMVHCSEGECISYSNIVRVSKEDRIISQNSQSQKNLLEGKIYFRLIRSVTLGSIMRDYCVKTDLVRKVGGYDKERYFYEDFELILRLSKHARFYCTNSDGTAYRVSETGLSNRSYQEQLKTINEIILAEICQMPPLLKEICYLVRIMIYTLKILGCKIKGSI